jgi:serine/threonine-protein kinase
MVRLQLLGSQRITLETGGSLDAVVAQPKRFALLAYLALAAGDYVRRDIVLAVFWPELDQFAARRALRNTLYQLRRTLGTEVLCTRGDEDIAVDCNALWCDVTALASAVDAGRYDEAVALYQGELLRGFHLPGGGEEFEDWLLAARERSTRQVMRALEALIAREEGAGHPLDAARWAVRAQELAPYEEVRVRRTMALLDAAGDRGSALLAYDTFTRRFQEEMGSAPRPSRCPPSGYRPGPSQRRYRHQHHHRRRHPRRSQLQQRRPRGSARESGTARSLRWSWAPCWVLRPGAGSDRAPIRIDSSSPCSVTARVIHGSSRSAIWRPTG